MRRFSLAALALAIIALAVPANVRGQHCPLKPACCQQYQVVEEICYKDVVRKWAVAVPDVKKVPRWVYSNYQEDFAAPCCGLPHCSCKHGCDGSAPCSTCGKVMCKSPLIKRLVFDEILITKCVVECQVEKVACVMYRKVPCGSAPPGGIIMPSNGAVVAPALPNAGPEAIPAPMPSMPPAPISGPLPATVVAPQEMAPTQPVNQIDE